MFLSKALKRENNNLDIFRLFAALSVIFGHAYALSPMDGAVDPIGRLLGYTYSGDLAVKSFFFLSGLVVTNSLLVRRNIINFCIARFFRIWPAFTFVILMSSLIVGPILTNLKVSEYFSNIGVYSYIYKNIFMNISYGLPGLFSENPYKNAVNGSLWTIPYEIGAYLFLIVLYLFGIFQRNKVVPTIIAILIILDPLFNNRLVFTFLVDDSYRFLAPSFAFGALLALHKDYFLVVFQKVC
ncbi:acyltransferase [Acinetobacter sp. MD2(2019)]|uniref:acyltransferase family protein n=1 Tax=Acinetobacter sp. MD2(2019) TaxID=2605273 RepID=UPI002D1F93C3|nr:acyltransferase [Acinetobacter sp. MD2(2019)]MEB3752734.1 acyltransferase [Acinetobacter sp. MD2(2019)]